MIDGKTRLIAHLGYPTESFKAPMIYNPYFAKHRINAVVVPMGCKPEDFPEFFKPLFRLSNIHGALITMPHKVPIVALLDEVSVSVKVAGACNAVRVDRDGKLVGDMFDGEGFVRGVIRKGRKLNTTKYGAPHRHVSHISIKRISSGRDDVANIPGTGTACKAIYQRTIIRED